MVLNLDEYHHLMKSVHQWHVPIANIRDAHGVNHGEAATKRLAGEDTKFHDVFFNAFVATVSLFPINNDTMISNMIIM